VSHLLVHIIDLLPSHECCRGLHVLLHAHVAETNDHLLNRVEEVYDLLAQDDHHFDKLNLHLDVFLGITGVVVANIRHLLFANVSEHKHGPVAALVEQIQLFEGVKMDTLLQSGRHDVLDDALANLLVPVIVNLAKLVVNILLLLFLDLLDQCILLLNQLADLRLLLAALGILLELRLQFLDGLLQQLDFVAVLLVLVLEVEKELFIINLLLLHLA